MWNDCVRRFESQVIAMSSAQLDGQQRLVLETVANELKQSLEALRIRSESFQGSPESPTGDSHISEVEGC